MPATTPARNAPPSPAEPIISVNDAGPCLKRLDLEIPASTVSAELDSTFGALSSQAAIPGFRPGKAPRKLIERMFGKTARDDARRRLVTSAVQKAVRDNKLRVVGDPELGSEFTDLELAPDKPLKLSLDVEVAPEFDLPPLDNIAIKKPVFTTTPEQINEEIQRLCVHEGDLEPRDKTEPGDYCTGKGIIRDEAGKPALEINGAVIQIPTPDKNGKGAILGVLVDDFAKQVGLPKVGDTLHVKAKGPPHHETAAIRGKPITIEFSVERVDRIVPLSVGALCLKVGAPSEDALRDALAARLSQRNAIRQQSHMRRQVADHLLKTIDIEIPSKLSERQAARNLERRRLELMYRGLNVLEIDEQIAAMRAESADAARRELKLFFILDKVATDLSIQATESEINSRITQMAMERGLRPDRLRNELIQRGQIGFLVQQIREHKALDALVAKAKAEETPGEQFEKSLEA